MQTLSRTELIWIHAELVVSISRAETAAREAEEAGYPACARIALTRRDGLRSIAHKLQIAIDNHGKRIAIK